MGGVGMRRESLHFLSYAAMVGSSVRAILRLGSGAVILVDLSPSLESCRMVEKDGGTPLKRSCKQERPYIGAW